MKLSTRRSVICDMLAATGRVRVDELAQETGVSTVTIRNDLAQLEREGWLSRVPGGAVQTRAGLSSADFVRRTSERALQKRAVATCAAALVTDGMTLMINSGATTYFTALALTGLKNLKVVTNSIRIATELSSRPGLRTTLLGGQLNPQFSFTYGADAVEGLKLYRADRAILSVDGVNTSGLTTYNAEEAEVNRMMIERSGSVTVVADGSKLGRDNFCYLCELSYVDTLITSDDADPAHLAALRDAGLTIITAHC